MAFHISVVNAPFSTAHPRIWSCDINGGSYQKENAERLVVLRGVQSCHPKASDAGGVNWLPSCSEVFDASEKRREDELD